eukprot:363484-Chlamydomonas_euryale.AAC.7
MAAECPGLVPRAGGGHRPPPSPPPAPRSPNVQTCVPAAWTWATGVCRVVKVREDSVDTPMALRVVDCPAATSHATPQHEEQYCWIDGGWVCDGWIGGWVN